MRWFFRLGGIVLLAGLVVVVVWFAVLESERLQDFSQTILDNHWQLTALRVGILGLVLGSLFLFERRKQVKVDQGPRTFAESIRSSKIPRIGVWLLLIELLFGQSALRHLLSLFSA